MVKSLLLLLLLFRLSSELILPLTKANGDVDLQSLLSHVTLLEQTVSSLQTQQQANTKEMTILQTKVQTTENELKSVQTDQKITAGKLAAAESQLASTQTELNKVKADLKSAQVELALLKQNSSRPVVAAFNTTAIDIMGADMKSFVAELAAVKSDVLSLNQDINNTNSELRLLEADFYAAGINISDLGNASTSPHSPGGLMSVLQNVTDEVNILKCQISSSSVEVGNITKEAVSLRSELVSIRNDLSIAETELVRLQQDLKDGSLDVNDTSFKNISDLLGADIVFQMSLADGRNNWRTLIFDTVEYNPSLAYNETSGIFTAPVPGNYLFWANLHVDCNNYGSENKYVYLKSGTTVLTKGFTRTPTPKDHGWISFTTVVHLQEGEDVYFATDSITNVIEGNGVSSYGGALLHITL